MNSSTGSERLQELYRTSGEMVRLSFGDQAAAQTYFEPYLDFVSRVAPPAQTPAAPSQLLDVGCGSGWSSYFFAQRGYDTTGLDLNPNFFEPPPLPNLTLVEGSALELPFDDAAFDVVTAFQTLEHIPDPRRALLEMLRVCRPGGTLCIVGPNLLSLGMALRSVVNALGNRPAARIVRRVPEMPRHPFGNTLGEALMATPNNASRALRKLLAPRVVFSMRRPDVRPPFYSDNDACYICNPIDLRKFLTPRGCRVVRDGAFHRLPHTSLIQTGTWFAAQKPPR